MVKYDLIPLERHDEWEAALRGIPHAFGHTWESCHAMNLTTHLPTFLLRAECQQTVIVCPLAERRFDGTVDLVTPYGLSGFTGGGECEEFPGSWHRFARDRGYVCAYVGLNPLFARESYIFPEDTHEYSSVYVLDLTLSEADLFDNLSRNRRRQIQVRAKSGCRPSLEREALCDFFVRHYHQFMAHRGAAPVYRFSVETLAALAQCDNTLLIGAGGPDGIEAVILFGYTPYAAESLFNVSLPRGRHHSAWLLWEGLRWLRALGVPVLNLGGGVRPDDGVAQFKERFGARPLPLRAAKQVFAHDIYERLCVNAHVDPRDRAGYFPGYRAPQA